MRISDWSSDVCSSDLPVLQALDRIEHAATELTERRPAADHAQLLQRARRELEPGGRFGVGQEPGMIGRGVPHCSALLRRQAKRCRLRQGQRARSRRAGRIGTRGGGSANSGEQAAILVIHQRTAALDQVADLGTQLAVGRPARGDLGLSEQYRGDLAMAGAGQGAIERLQRAPVGDGRSEEHTSELQSLMRTSYAVFCLKKKKRYYTMKVSIQ